MTFEKFQRLKLTTFEGKNNPLTAEEWIIELEHLFRYLNYKEEQKVYCVNFCFHKTASYCGIPFIIFEMLGR